MIEPKRARGINLIPTFLDAIKFQESVFALPFAYIGMILASQGLPTLKNFILITIAMVSARTIGMIANRIIDRKIDSQNPRTSMRHLPSGILTINHFIIPGTISCIVLFTCAFMLNPLAFWLSPVALAYLIFYPYTKRFTWAANLLLGWALAIAPSAAWIGVKGTLTWEPFVLSLSVALWAGSFDIIYHCQDVEFQTKNGLHSVGQKFGITKAFLMSKILDIGSIICLISLGFIMDLSIFYFVACIIAGSTLAYKYVLVKPDDLSKIGMAFMRINALVSLTMFIGTSLAVLV